MRHAFTFEVEPFEFQPEFEPEYVEEFNDELARQYPRRAPRKSPGMNMSQHRARTPNQPRPQPRSQPPRVGATRRDHARAHCVCPQHKTEFVRWVQHSLNQVLGLQLPVSGVMNPETRSALRRFQKEHNLPQDGIAGPETEKALIDAKTGSGHAPPASDAELFEQFDSEYGWDSEEELPVSRPSARTATFRYVKDFSGPAAECTAALTRAGKTKAEALTMINAQIGVAITLLRKAATHLKRGSRSAKTKILFKKIFRVTPEFVPTWFKPTATIKDRGDVVATRCKRVADLLESGTLKYFCAINATNCPDCGPPASPSAFACSSFGNDRVVCLGTSFWDDMKNGNTRSLFDTLMHEPFHIYYGTYVTEHRSTAGKFGGIYCIVQFVFNTNNRAADPLTSGDCTAMAVRR